MNGSARRSPSTNTTPSSWEISLAGQSDDALHVHTTYATLNFGLFRCVEDDDLATLGIAEVEDEPICDHPVRSVRLAA